MKAPAAQQVVWHLIAGMSTLLLIVPYLNQYPHALEESPDGLPRNSPPLRSDAAA